MKPHGKMQRLVDNLVRVAGPVVAERITAGMEVPAAGASRAIRSAWVRAVIDRMDAMLSETERRHVMEARRCPPSRTGIAADLELWQDCEDLADYARRKAPRWGGDGFVAEGNSLRLRIARGRCYCLLQGSAAAPISKTHCLCCAGHLRGGLEPVFALPVPVEPLSTVISGDPECWFVAYVGGPENQNGPPVRPAKRVRPTAPAPLRAPCAPFPVELPPAKRPALRAVYGALVAIATAATAATPAQQLRLRTARPRLFAALWCLARHGVVRGQTLGCETRSTRDLGGLMPGVQGSRELGGYRIPGIEVAVTVTRSAYPRRWEVRLAMPQRGAVAALRTYVEALCQAHGEPVFAGSNRFVGEAFRRFCRADLAVLAVDRPAAGAAAATAPV